MKKQIILFTILIIFCFSSFATENIEGQNADTTVNNALGWSFKLIPGKTNPKTQKRYGAGMTSMADVYAVQSDTKVTVTGSVYTMILGDTSVIEKSDWTITADTDVLFSTSDSTVTNGLPIWQKSYVPIKDTQILYIKSMGGSATVYVRREEE